MTGSAAIDALLAAARAGLDRVQPADLAAELAAGALVVDIRPIEQRQRDGDLPNALVIDRNVLEWRLDPTSPHHIPEISDPDRRVVVVCNQGYSSSLAAATLRQLGLERATDLVDGFQAWKRSVKQHGLTVPVTGQEATCGSTDDRSTSTPQVIKLSRPPMSDR